MRSFDTRWCDISRGELRTVLLAAGIVLLAVVAGRMVAWVTAEPDIEVRGVRETVAAPPRLDVNSATVQDLMLLKGIGPHTAEAIVSYRTENGPFERLEDLTRVHGIGQATLESLRPELMCRPPEKP